MFSGANYAPWIVEHGIVNIIQQKLYEDPHGFPKLSESQSKRFEWFKRPRDFIPQKYRNPVINVGDNISGFEVNQGSIDGNSIVASLSLAGHLELKLDYK